MNQGYIRVGAVVPSLSVGNVTDNVKEIKKMVEVLERKKVSIITFPEHSLTGYTCQDMFFNATLLDEVKSALSDLCDFSKSCTSVIVVGAVLNCQSKLYNCAVVIYRGEILGVVPKTYLANYNEFYEQRWFTSALQLNENQILINGKYYPFGTDILFRISDEICFGVEICEDLWAVKPPSDDLALAGANIILNLSASNETIGKYEFRKNLVSMQSAKTLCAYVYASSGVNESTTDLLYSGQALIVENGSVLSENERFDFESNFIYADVDYEFLNQERFVNKTFSFCSDKNVNRKFREIKIDLEIENFAIERVYNKLPFVPSGKERGKICNEIIKMQSFALAKRMKSSGINKLVIGVSGGLDSTIALLVCVKAMEIMKLPFCNIIAITMQGYGTTNRTYKNAKNLIELLGATFKEIGIKSACEQHFKDIDLKDYNSLAFENAQARERTQILFDVANLENALVVGTGDMSELALGWCTYNGDHMSSYAVNAGVPKTLIKYLIESVALEYEDGCAIRNILFDIIDTPISPELTVNSGEEITQKTEQIIGTYEINDFFLYHFLRRRSRVEKIKQIAMSTFDLSEDEAKAKLNLFINRFFTNQFKRSCLPDSVKIGSVCLSPRGDFRMSSDIDKNIWMLKENKD